MDNLWEFKLTPEEIVSPKTILDEQSKYLMEITKDIVFVNIDEYKPRKKNNLLNSIYDVNDEEIDFFYYRFVLRSKFKKDYGFRMFSIKYSISMYPVEIINLDTDILTEINCQSKQIAKSEDEFKKIIKKILNSSKVIKVIKVLMSNQL